MRVVDEISEKDARGWLCISLINTVENRNEEVWLDYLSDIDMLVDGLHDRGIIDATQHHDLHSRIKANQKLAKKLLAETKLLRELLFQVFSAIGNGLEPDKSTMASLNKRVSEVYSHLELCLDGNRVRWCWRDAEGNLDAILWPVVHSAAQLLTSTELDRLRNCDGDSCTFLFLDRSKNRSRRWCTMDVCGNRAKSKRHYARTKAQ